LIGTIKVSAVVVISDIRVINIIVTVLSADPFALLLPLRMPFPATRVSCGSLGCAGWLWLLPHLCAPARREM
jgi:hypothetical protein